MKKTYIREGSLAWYCKKLWKPAVMALVATGLLVAIMASAEGNEPAQANTQPQQEKPAETKIVDFKPQSVEEMICMECDEYGVDAELAIAIARLETGNFTSAAYTEGNNVGGLSHDEEPIAFKDLERGVEAFVMNLHYNYYAEGLDTVEEIAPKYCPVNQQQWAESVNAIMEEGETDVSIQNR